MKINSIILSVISGAVALLIISIGVFYQIATPLTLASANDRAIASKPVQSRLWIVTGGQTGVDRAALDTALSLFLPVRGWCPKGRLAEDGMIPPVYPLQETTSAEYAVRTEWNVRDSDATLILAYEEPLAGGTKLTQELAQRYRRPALVLNALSFGNKDLDRFREWISANQIRILNIAGPRESSKLGVIYNRARDVLTQFLK
jgi:Circularly permutated YpsA SLOG family